MNGNPMRPGMPNQAQMFQMSNNQRQYGQFVQQYGSQVYPYPQNQVMMQNSIPPHHQAEKNKKEHIKEDINIIPPNPDELIMKSQTIELRVIEDIFRVVMNDIAKEPNPSGNDFKGNLTKETLLAIVYALKLKAYHFVNRSVFYSKKRRNAYPETEKCITSVPVSRFSMLSHENNIIRTNQRIIDQGITNSRIWIDMIGGLASRKTGSEKVELLYLLSEIRERKPEEDNLSPDDFPIIKRNQSISIDDIYRAIEEDSSYAFDLLYFRSFINKSRFNKPQP